MQKLLIIESPNKIKTLKQYLDKDFKIIATVGHIRDLSQFGMGFDKDFEPKWVVIDNKNKNNSKKEVIDDIKKSASFAKEIYIATDPDREGEAIAWHVFEILKNEDKNKCKRVTFNEITKNAILKSFDNKRDIDNNWVHSQFARRIIDRLIGFKLSKLLRNKIKADSAGRVQSVALKFIKDREEEISKFVSEFWWTLEVELDKNKLTLKQINNEIENVFLSNKNFSSGINFLDENSALKIKDCLTDEFKIINIKDPTYQNQNPKPPFKTSTLQQAGFNILGWSSKKTMSVAQRLYEGVEIDGKQIALISYPRTDSIRLSEYFVTSGFEYIEKKYGKEFVGQYKNNSSKKDQKIQDAHEAIRPTDVWLSPDSLKSKLNKDDFSLYQLIYNKAISSLMASAKFKKIVIEFENNKNIFYTSSKQCLFIGFKILDNYDKNEEDSIIDFDKYKINSIIQKSKNDLCEVKKHQTTPPARYTQATLIAELEAAGVGRPSTYNTMANVTLDRGYAVIENKAYHITEIGKTVANHLDLYFPNIINKNFTKKMEDHLDSIANGDEEWKVWIKDFVPSFDNDIKNAYDKMEKVKDEEVGRNCNICLNPLVYKHNKKNHSKFIGCSNYPTCKYLEAIEKPKEIEDKCPECNSILLIRKSKKGSEFIGCSGFPKCKYLLSDKFFNWYKLKYQNKNLPKNSELDEFKKEFSKQKYKKN